MSNTTLRVISLRGNLEY